MAKLMVELLSSQEDYALDKENFEFGIYENNFLSIFFIFCLPKREKWRD